MDIRVTARDFKEMREFDGITIFPGGRDLELKEHFVWADVVITHLDVTRQAIGWCKNVGRPLVHLVHNHKQLDYHRVTPARAQLVVWNSEWTQKIYKNWGGKSIILNPPVFAEDYKTKRGDRITLMNLNEAKGGKVFWELAEKLPKEKFLAVQGSYGHQEIPDHIPSNVKLVPNSPDAKSIYSQTKLLLMPSSYESWGRTGVEAIASGIPVIAHPTLGLKESLGDAGIFINRDEVDAWRLVIEALGLAPQLYDRQSKLAFKRSAQLDPRPQLEAFHKEMVLLAEELQSFHERERPRTQGQADAFRRRSVLPGDRRLNERNERRGARR